MLELIKYFIRRIKRDGIGICSWQVGFFMFGIVNFFKIFLFDGLFALNKPLLWRHL